MDKRFRPACRSLSSRSVFDLSLLRLQELKEKQKELENKARLFSRLAGEKSSGKLEAAFKSNTAPLLRKQPAGSKPSKQQAVVQPLQGQPQSSACMHHY